MTSIVDDDAVVPAGWALAALGDLRLDSLSSVDPSRFTDELFDLYSLPAHDLGSFEHALGRDIGSTKKLLASGSVVVAKINPHISRVRVVGPHRGYRQVGSSEWIVFPPIAGVAPAYLAHFLRWDRVRTYLATHVSGVGGSLMRTNAATVDAIPFALPPSREQGAITETLDSYCSRLDAAIVSLERVQAKLKAYRASVLKAAVEGRLVPTEAELARREKRSYEHADVLLARILKERRRRWEEAELAKLTAAGKTPKDDRWKANYEEPPPPDTSNLPALPESWCWVSVEQLASDQPRAIQSGPFGSNLLHSEFRPEGKLVIGIDNVQDGYFSMGAEHRIDDEKFRELEHYAARGGDVLVTVMATVGRTCVVPDEIEPAIITKHVYRITPERELVAPRYLHLALWGGPAVRAQIFGQAIGQTRPGLNGGIIRSLAIPLPPRLEQERIVEAGERLLSFRDETARALAHDHRRVQRLRQSILKWAFEGKLVDQDPADEPAETLLARIRAERAAGGPTKKTRGRKAKAAT